MARYGAIVANTGVSNAKDRDKEYSSEFQSPKLLKAFKGAFTTDSNGKATVTVEHGLSYSPFAIAYYKKNGRWLSPDNGNFSMQTSPRYAQFLVDYDAGVSTANRLAANSVFPYKIYVFVDPVQEQIS